MQKSSKVRKAVTLFFTGKEWTKIEEYLKKKRLSVTKGAELGLVLMSEETEKQVDQSEKAFM